MSIVPVVVVHGGAGDVPPASRLAHRDGAERAAAAGRDVLAAGGSALDAVEAAVQVLEDDPLYNAGTGACLTEAGTIELDASIMEGTTLRAGAVTCLPPFTSPIAIARAVLEDGRHVMYAGEGAAAFARSRGFHPAELDALITVASRRRLDEVLAGRASSGWAGGTVGAVACDAAGRVAAATSTGGMVAKACGRVGDSPIVGAGTYADDALGAASATGHGESAIRIGATRTACEALGRGLDAHAAAAHAVQHMRARTGGEGGIILVDRRGQIGLAWSTATMTHAIARIGEAVRSGAEARA